MPTRHLEHSNPLDSIHPDLRRLFLRFPQRLNQIFQTAQWPPIDLFQCVATEDRNGLNAFARNQFPLVEGAVRADAIDFYSASDCVLFKSVDDINYARRD